MKKPASSAHLQRSSGSHVLGTFESEAPELPALLLNHVREAFAANTQLALRSDWRVWRTWALAQSQAQTPADSIALFPIAPEALRAFIAAHSPPLIERGRGVQSVDLESEARGTQGAQVKAATTLSRYLCSISTLHRLAGVVDPTREPSVVSARRLYTRGRMASAQKAPLSLDLIVRVVDALGVSPWDLRARALLLTAHSTLARRSELVALRVEDLQTTSEGDGVALLRRSKSDQAGLGSERYLSALAVASVRAWLEAARIEDGAVFRRLRPGGRVGAGAVTAHEVARIFKEAVARYAVTLSDAERRRQVPLLSQISAHSTRIGAAQNLVESGADLVAVMQAGGWSDTGMPALYTRKLSALRGGMAKLYRERGAVEGTTSVMTEAGSTRALTET